MMTLDSYKKENEELYEDLKYYKNKSQRQQQEIQRLNNIINEFEKYLINEIKRLENVEQTPAIVLITGKIHDIYDELQQLKEGK